MLRLSGRVLPQAIAVPPIAIRAMSARVEMWDSTAKLVEGIISGNRAALARGITLAESRKQAHSEQADLMLDAVAATIPENQTCASDSRSTGQTVDHPHIRIGIAGPPGAGKSTFIDALGCYLTDELNQRVAVLAIDPSSSTTGGSILGDKTRMLELARRPSAFVRPSPSAGTLGGVAEHTADLSMLCEAAGFDTVLIETVGLGQSEVLVDDVCDMTFLLVNPAGGDELQGVKKGIMEIADAVLVNKADGDLVPTAKRAASHLKRALMLQRRKWGKRWDPPVRLVSAQTKDGLPEVWEMVEKFEKALGGPAGRDVCNFQSLLTRKRIHQAEKWMWGQLDSQLVSMARSSPAVAAAAGAAKQDLACGAMTSRRAGRQLVDAFTSELCKDR